MIRTLSLIKRRADIERSDFREHYETVHAPLALPHMTGLVRYVRYHLEEELFGEVAFDVISAFWYRDAESAGRMLEVLQGPAGQPILEDELTFMDKPANTFFSVSERMLAEGEEGDVHDWLLVRRPDGVERTDASRRLVRDHLPELMGPAPRFALLRDAFPVDGRPPRYDAVLQIVRDDGGPFDTGVARLEAAGWQVAGVRTRRFETDLGA